MTPTLDDVIGTLHGTWRTYLQPGQLYDEAALTMEVVRTDSGWLITYEGPIKEDDVTGSMRQVQTDGETERLVRRTTGQKGLRPLDKVLGRVQETRGAFGHNLHLGIRRG